MSEEYLFYGHRKNLKEKYILLAVLSSLCFLSGLASIILYYLLPYYNAMKDLIAAYIALTCLGFAALSLSIYGFIKYRYDFYIAITENEIIIFDKGKIHKYGLKGFQGYKIIWKIGNLTKFKIFLSENEKIAVITKKESALIHFMSTSLYCPKANSALFTKFAKS